MGPREILRNKATTRGGGRWEPSSWLQAGHLQERGARVHVCVHVCVRACVLVRATCVHACVSDGGRARSVWGSSSGDASP
jgi:hypothetical protein